MKVLFLLFLISVVTLCIYLVENYRFYELPDNYRELDCDKTEKVIVGNELKAEGCL